MNEQKFDINRLRVASPCSMGWESMTGDERKRFCAACELSVYNIAEMTAAEVRALIGDSAPGSAAGSAPGSAPGSAAASAGSICGRIYRRFDGTVITRDCPSGVRALRKRAARFAGAALSTVLGLFSAGVAQTIEQNGGAAGPAAETKLKNEKTALSPGKRILAGTVFDLQGNVIAGAELMIYPKNSDRNDFKNNIKTRTDGGGKYIFDGPAAGTYLIEANLPGYAHSVASEVELANGEQITLDIRLSKYEPITGLVNIILLPPPSVPGKTVITREELDRMPKRNLF